MFEQVWTRELELVFGSTTLAISTVLSVFMGGLGLGSWLTGRLADRIRDRRRAYALAEAGVGIYALGVPWILRLYPSLNAALYRLLGDHMVALSLGRFVASALLLLVPTTLMGSTLPLLSRHFVGPDQKTTSIGATVGSLYALNTLGAVVGTFLGGFVLLPNVGVKATNYLAAGSNLTLAVLVFLTRNLQPRAQLPDVPVVEEEEVVAPFTATPGERRLVLWGFAVSGAAAMTTEVLWTRALAVVLGSSVYSFTLILLAFLVGLAGGAALVSRLSAQSRRPMEWLAVVHASVALSIGLSYLVMDKLPAAFLGLLRGGAFSVDGILFCQFLLAALAVLPATLCMGGVFPLTIRIFTSGAARVGRDVGNAYSINTVGAIIGSFAAGFIVLPLMGLQRGLGLCALSSAALAAAFFFIRAGAASPWRCRRWRCSPCWRCRAGAWSIFRRACSACRSPRTSSRATSGRCRDSTTTTTASPPPSPSSAGRRRWRSRTTARSTPRTATTWRRRSWSASCRSSFITTPSCIRRAWL